jgi:Mrp family chromosome partitioning ATPase
MRTSTPGLQLERPAHQQSSGRHSRVQESVRLSGDQYGGLREYQLMWDRLALRLLGAQELSYPMIVGVTSSIPGEGKTAGSIALAVALARECSAPVALVEANFLNPTLAGDFGVPDKPGLADYLLGRCHLLDLARATSIEQLRLFPAGEPPRTHQGLTPATLNRRFRQRLHDMLDQMSRDFSCVVLDMPPVLGNVDTQEMIRYIHGAILVVRSGVTPLEQLRQATQQLAHNKLLGVVHLGQQRHIPRWLSLLTSE